MKTIYALVGCSALLLGLTIGSSLVALGIAKQSAVQAAQLQELQIKNNQLGDIVKAREESKRATALPTHRSR